MSGLARFGHHDMIPTHQGDIIGIPQVMANQEPVELEPTVSQNNFSKSMWLLYDPMREYLVFGDAVMMHRFSVESDVP